MSISRVLIIIGLLLAVFAGPALAWEFAMTGEWEWRYRYYTRTGNHDIFGYMDGNNVNLGGNHLKTFPAQQTGQENFFLPPTATTTGYGVQAGENNFGSEQNLIDNRMTLEPVIEVNKAITISGSLNLTSLGIWSDGQPYKNNGQGYPGAVNDCYVPINELFSGVNAPNTYLTMQWIKCLIKTPMLDFNLGFRTSGVGMGLWKNAKQYPSASFEVIATYGPLRFGLIPYFGRSQSQWSTNGTSRNEGAKALQRQSLRRNFITAWEGEIFYSAGNLDAWIQSDSFCQSLTDHVTPRQTATGQVTNGGTQITTVSTTGLTTLPGDLSVSQPDNPGQDFLRYRITSGFRYANCRTFCNAEYVALYQWHSGRGMGSPPPAAANLVQKNQNVDSALYGIEAGYMAGPAKITGNYVVATGNDPSNRVTSGEAKDGDEGMSSIYMKDWGYLMYFLYGTGTCWDVAGQGQPTNMRHVGGRLDYAVAANLNVYGLYSYSWRDHPNAFRLGGDYLCSAQTFSNDDVFNSQKGAFVGHAVPDSARDIGWEVDAGVSWQLLSNFTCNTTLAFWQPGTWWSYAYPNTANVYIATGGQPAHLNTVRATNAANEAMATFDLGRRIDPLFAVEEKISIKF